MFYWHVHHDVLVEWSDNIQERIDYIEANKPANEQATRLQLLRPVVGHLPAEIIEAMEAYDKAGEAYNKAGKACDEAWEAHDKEINALHAIECPNCPWDGKTIFRGIPRKRVLPHPTYYV